MKTFLKEKKKEIILKCDEKSNSHLCPGSRVVLKNLGSKRGQTGVDHRIDNNMLLKT